MAQKKPTAERGRHGEQGTREEATFQTAKQTQHKLKHKA